MALTGQLQLARAAFALQASFEIEGGVTTVSGRSGAGKTTLLRCIAGLERAVRGRLAWGDDIWLDSEQGISLPVERRGVGLVSQDAELFPHLDVRANLVYGQRRVRGRPAVQLEPVLQALELGDLLGRAVQGLSGGERRRVAIGRALLSSPRLLLLDEPVSALDGAGRREVLDGVRAAVDALGVPCLFVSHDIQDAARVAQRMWWMERGSIVSAGPLAAVLCDPALPFAQSENAAAVIEATVVSERPELHLSRLEFAGGELWAALGDAPPRRPVRIQIAARDVSLARVRPEKTSVLNVIDCEIREIQAAAQMPAQALVRLDAGGTPLLARVTWKSVNELDLAPGERVWAMVKSVAVLE